MKKNLLPHFLILPVLIFYISCNLDKNQETPVQLSQNLFKIITGSVSSLILTGEEGSLIVDTSNEETGENIKAAIEKLGAGDIKYIINTHWHHDHCLGNIGLGKKAVIISHDNAGPLLSDPQRLDFYDEDYKALPEHARPNLTFAGKITLHLYGEDIELIHFPQGHTNNDIIVYFRNANIVHLGDMIFPDMFPFIDVENGGNVKQLAENLGKIIKLMPEDVRIISGHGRDYTLKDLDDYQKMLNTTFETVSREIEKGRSLEEIQEMEILKDYKKWEHERNSCGNWVRMIFYSQKKKDSKI
jgi:glyoxylase-like metal-dependent hydrolase (beta-lactamase superfamily II)